MIQLDPDDGAVRIEFPHGEAITVEGLPARAVVERGTERGLFLEHAEADTLANMIKYILDKVRIKPESADALRAVLPRVEALFEE